MNDAATFTFRSSYRLMKSLGESVEDGGVQGIGKVGSPVVEGSLSCRSSLDGEAEGGYHGQPRVLNFG